MTDSPTPWPAVHAAFEQLASAVLAAWDAWKAYLRQLFAPRLLPQPRPAAPQPRTLHLAMQANAHPVRPWLDRRPTRTPATRRR